jgi:hypothetical protein
LYQENFKMKNRTDKNKKGNHANSKNERLAQALKENLARRKKTKKL